MGSARPAQNTNLPPTTTTTTVEGREMNKHSFALFKSFCFSAYSLTTFAALRALKTSTLVSISTHPTRRFWFVDGHLHRNEGTDVCKQWKNKVLNCALVEKR